MNLRDYRQVPTISLILLTHATISHIGAYAHCCKHVPLFSQIPVYATTPVTSLGRTLLQDLYASTPLAASFLPHDATTEPKNLNTNGTTATSKILLEPPTAEEIAGYFAVINPLKYSQTQQPSVSSFSPPSEGLTITAYCAGHTLGGTIWHIQHGSESVVYALDWNQGRENVLPSAAWLAGSGATGAEIIEQLRKPTALVCSSKGAETVAIAGGLRRRDDLLIGRIRDTIAAGGSVLIPCDGSARALELAYLLERAWSADAAFKPAKLCLASSTCNATMRYARSMLEWMDETVIREFEAANTSKNANETQAQPFSFKHLKLIERNSQLNGRLSSKAPTVWLASDLTLEWGFSKRILERLSSDEKNLIIIPERRSQPDEQSGQFSLLQRLQGLAANEDGQQSTSNGDETTVRQCNDEEIELQNAHTNPLTGDELTTYEQYLARRRHLQSTMTTEKQTALEASADVVDDESSSSSDDDDDDDDVVHQGKALNVSATLAHTKNKTVTLTDEDLGINILLRKKDVHDYDVRRKRGREKIFPFMAKRRRQDDFGDIIRPEDFLRAEEREDTAGEELAGILAKGENALGQKRRWDDKEEKKNDDAKGANGQSNKKRRLDRGRQARSDLAEKARLAEEAESESESEESDYEPEEAVIRGPSSVTITTSKIQLKLKITSIDMSGIHDKRSLHMLIPLIRPRKLILTGGTKHETESLAEACRTMLLSSTGGKSMTTSEILTPAIGVLVDASVDTNAWTIKLDRKLYSRLTWQNFRTVGIVTINGRLSLPQKDVEDDGTAESAAKRQKLLEAAGPNPAAKSEGGANERKELMLPVLVPNSSATGANQGIATNQALHIGDLRLAELRRMMQAHGHSAEFKGEGTLLVDGIIAVRKSGIGKIEVESGGAGPAGALAAKRAGGVSGAGSSFFDVRKKIYDGLAVVAAR